MAITNAKQLICASFENKVVYTFKVSVLYMLLDWMQADQIKTKIVFRAIENSGNAKKMQH